MSLTKGRAAIAQLTAGGTSTTIDVSPSYSQTLLIKHSNGSGAVTVAASIDVQVKAAGGSLWYSLTGGPIALGTTTAAIEDKVVFLPDPVASVRVVYVAPTGPTGFTLDAECGDITSL